MWIGPTLDLDDVIKSLEDTIAVLSDVRGFGREHEYRIAVINNAGAPDYELDDLAPKLDAADRFNGLILRKRRLVPLRQTDCPEHLANPNASGGLRSTSFGSCQFDERLPEAGPDWIRWLARTNRERTIDKLGSGKMVWRARHSARGMRTGSVDRQ